MWEWRWACVRKLEVCLLTSLVLFKLFWQLEGRARGGSAKQQRQLLHYYFFFSFITGLCTSADNSSISCLNHSESLSRGKRKNAPSPFRLSSQLHSDSSIPEVRFFPWTRPDQLNNWWTACNMPSTGEFLDKEPHSLTCFFTVTLSPQLHMGLRVKATEKWENKLVDCWDPPPYLIVSLLIYDSTTSTYHHISLAPFAIWCHPDFIE